MGGEQQAGRDALSAITQRHTKVPLWCAIRKQPTV